MVKIHSLYVRHLLPMTIEIQYWEFPEPSRTPADVRSDVERSANGPHHRRGKGESR